MSLASQLSALQSLGLIRSVGQPEESEFLFRHTLFQEAAYRSLLRGERADLHRSVATVLERTHSGDEEAVAPLLAYQFLQAGDEVSALRYFTLAAEAAAKVYANQEAVEHYQRAIELALRVDPDPMRLIDLYTGCGRLHELMGDFDGALHVYDVMQTKSEALDLPQLGIKARVARDTLYSSPSAVSDHGKARSSAQETLELARAAGDREAEAHSLWNLMLAGFFRGDTGFSQHRGEEAMALAREIGDKKLLAFIINDLSRGYLFSEGLQERGVELLREATDLWRELDNLPMLADSLTGAAMFASYSGQYKESIEQATMAWELNTRIDNPWGKAYCQYVINGAYTELGDFEAASKSADEGLHWAKIAGFTVPQVMIPCNQALVCGIIGQYDRGLEVTDEAISFGRELLDFWLGAPLAVRLCLLVWKGDLKAAEVQAEDLRHLIDDLESVMFPIARLYVEYALNEYQLAVGEYQAALVSADELIDFQRKHNFVLLWSDALLQRSRAADALGQSEAAGEALKEAVAFAEANHSGRTLWLALHRLSQWTARNGDEAEAAALEGRARQALERVANTLDEDLRKSFLATPEASEAWSE